MPNRSDVYAYFWAEGSERSNAEVTALMGIEPSETHKGSGHVAKKNRWVLTRSREARISYRLCYLCLTRSEICIARLLLRVQPRAPPLRVAHW
jgi:hypothetical protein